MAVQSNSSVRLLEVELDADTREVQVELPQEGTALDKLNSLRCVVAACFGVDLVDLPVLQYQHGDEICTLTEASVEDMLEFTPDSPIRVFASTGDSWLFISDDCESFEEVNFPDDVVCNHEEVSPKSEKSDEGDSLVAPLLAMGFAKSDALSAIQKAEGNLENAVALLLKGTQFEQRSLLRRFIPQLSKMQPMQAEPLECEDLDAFLLSDSAVSNGGANDIVSGSNNEESVSTPDVAIDSSQYFHCQTEQIDNSETVDNAVDLSQQTSTNVEERSSLDDHVEAVSENNYDEHAPARTNSETASLGSQNADAFQVSVDACPIDKGQVFVSRFLSAIRTRQFLPPCMSSGAKVTRLDNMQIILSNSMSVVRSQTWRL